MKVNNLHNNNIVNNPFITGKVNNGTRVRNRNVQNSITELQKLIAERTGKPVPAQPQVKFKNPVQKKSVQNENKLVQLLSKAEKAFFDGIAGISESGTESMDNTPAVKPVRNTPSARKGPKIALGRNIDIRA